MSVPRMSAFLVWFVVAVSPVSLNADMQRQAAAVEQTVCGIALHPQPHRERRVSVRGRVYQALGRMYLRDESCPESLRLVISNAPVDPRSAKHLSDFRKYVSARVRPRAKNTLCAACSRYRVEATVFGRVSLEPQRAAGSSQSTRSVLSVDDVTGLEVEDLYGSFYSATQYAPAVTSAFKK
jgi:hypothetical protein